TFAVPWIKPVGNFAVASAGQTMVITGFALNGTASDFVFTFFDSSANPWTCDFVAATPTNITCNFTTTDLAPRYNGLAFGDLTIRVLVANRLATLVSFRTPFISPLCPTLC